MTLKRLDGAIALRTARRWPRGSGNHEPRALTLHSSGLPSPLFTLRISRSRSDSTFKAKEQIDGTQAGDFHSGSDRIASGSGGSDSERHRRTTRKDRRPRLHRVDGRRRARLSRDGAMPGGHGSAVAPELAG